MTDIDKHLYVCTKCHTWLSGKKEHAASGCTECGSDLQYVPVDYYEYSSWTPEQKTNFKKQFLRDMTNGNVQGSYTVSSIKNRQKEESSSSGWISGLKFVGWASFIVFILLGLALFGSFGPNIIGIASFAVCFIVGFMSVAMTMVFLGMAQDIRIIRSRLQK